MNFGAGGAERSTRASTARPDMAEDDQTDLESLNEFATQRATLDPLLMQAALESALRRRGFKELLPEDKRGSGEGSLDRVSALAASLVLWGLGASVTQILGLPWYAVVPVVAAVAVAMAAVTKLLSGSAATGFLFLLTWVLLGIDRAINASFVAFSVTYLIPVVLALAYGAARRLLPLRDAQDVALALAGTFRSAPFVAPVVLVVLFLPALSADVWRVAAQLDAASLITVGLLSVGVLLVVVRIELGRQLEAVVAQRSRYLCALPGRTTLTRNQMVTGADPADSDLVIDLDDEVVRECWPQGGEEYAPYLRASTGDTLLRPLTGRLFITVGAVGALLTAYVYLLSVAVVPVDVARDWSQRAVPEATTDLFGWHLTLVGGPFLALSALLGLAATATFLSFAVIEDRFASALTDALLSDPTDRFLVIALPYVHLGELAIEEGRAARLEGRPPRQAPPLGPTQAGEGGS